MIGTVYTDSTVRKISFTSICQRFFHSFHFKMVIFTPSSEEYYYMNCLVYNVPSQAFTFTYRYLYMDQSLTTVV